MTHEVFSRFQAYPSQETGDLGEWVGKIMDGTLAADDDTLHDIIDLERGDGEMIRVHLTMRAIVADGQPGRIRGVIHDISDLQPPAPAAAYDQRTARTIAELYDDAPWGLGHFVLPTRVVTEWYSAPPPPLDQWVTEPAEWDFSPTPDVDELFDAITRGVIDNAHFRANVRLTSSSDWTPVDASVRAVAPGGGSNALLTVKVVAS